MYYFVHFKSNVKAALECLMLFVFHLIHAFIPIKITSHDYWGFFTKEDSQTFKEGEN